MFSSLKTAFLAAILFFSSSAAMAEGGKVILDIKPDDVDATEMINYPELYKEYLRELDVFDQKYPSSEIEEDFSDDILVLHPDYTDEQAQTKAGMLRLGIRGRRTYQFLEAQLKQFLLENEIPLQFADDQYEMGEAVEYQPSDKPLIIKDFKKVVAYSDSDKDRQAVRDKLARDAGQMTPYERGRILKKALVDRDWKTLFSYGLFDGTALEDKRGISDWRKTPELQARLLAAVKTLADKDEVNGALQLYANPGWFLLGREYQNNPGLQVGFETSENLKDIQLNWPLPQRYFVNLQQSFSGYPGLVTIPFKAKVVDIAKPLQLTADVSASLCNQQGCRPVKLSSQLKLDSGGKFEASKAAAMLRLMNRYVPSKSSTKLQLKRLIVEKTDNASSPQVLRLEVYADETPAAFEVFVEGTGVEEFAPPLVRIDGRRVVARFVPLNPETNLRGREFSIVAGTASNVAVRQVMTAEAAPLTEMTAGGLSIGLLLLAVFGGLLLNIMPCVFPVLALKLTAFTSFGGMDISRIRRILVGNILGIAAAFVLLIAALVGLKLLGRAIGWGMQFQSIGFITGMVFVISAFIAHLWGLVHLPTPSWGEKIISRSKSEFVIQFLSGVFVVLLSSACTAPYLGTVLGLALAGSPLQIAAVLSCVGFGLALPYLLFAVFPACAYYLPRPGKWLRWISLLMFALLFATLLWLLALLAAQGGAALWGWFTLFILAFWLILVVRKLAMEALEEQENDVEIYGNVRHGFNLLTVVLLAGLIFWAYHHTSSAVVAAHQPQPATVNEAEIRELLGQGQSVLVKIGANWCLNCKYNDFAAFDAPQVQQLLQQYNIAVWEVDWTDYNEEVLAFMQRFGRSGLPFYVLFTPRIPGGLVLPEILSEQTLRSLLEQLRR